MSTASVTDAPGASEDIKQADPIAFCGAVYRLDDRRRRRPTRLHVGVGVVWRHRRWLDNHRHRRMLTPVLRLAPHGPQTDRQQNRI
jgi:hypothetical protein